MDPPNLEPHLDPIWSTSGSPSGPLFDPYWTPSGRLFGPPSGPLFYSENVIRKCHFLSIGTTMTVTPSLGPSYRLFICVNFVLTRSDEIKSSGEWTDSVSQFLDAIIHPLVLQKMF